MKLTISQKMERIKEYLQKNGIEFKENHQFKNVTIPLFLPKYYIAIHPDDSQVFFNKVKHKLHPIFVRDTETAVFVLEKVKNTITKFEKK